MGVFNLRRSHTRKCINDHLPSSLPSTASSMASIHSAHTTDVKKDGVVTTENINSSVDYVRNVNATIVNPLEGIPKDQLRHKVDAFCESWGFQDQREYFQKGALIAQNPTTFEDIPELTEDDKYHIRRETTHKWHLPKDLYFAIALCSLGSAIQGWDNTGANGANLSFPQVRVFPQRS